METVAMRVDRQKELFILNNPGDNYLLGVHAGIQSYKITEAEWVYALLQWALNDANQTEENVGALHQMVRLVTKELFDTI